MHDLSFSDKSFFFSFDINQDTTPKNMLIIPNIGFSKPRYSAKEPNVVKIDEVYSFPNALQIFILNFSLKENLKIASSCALYFPFLISWFNPFFKDQI